MGKLTVRCPRCYHSFVFDPEDSASFRGGRYDLPGGDSNTQSPRSVRGFFRFLEDKFESIKSRFSRNRSYGWQNPGERPKSFENYNDQNRTGFGPTLAKYILFFLILIGITRTCFFSSQNWNESVPNWNSPETQEPSIPSPKEEDDDKAPQVEI
ncbi:hypothetical protein EHQ52_01355 [Leptospira koniambonensis]|uniref:Uncharacterized protein n=1 Tax=Leptospira koniambonensis TaxID=2484950 RepID=A0A4V6QLV6_9LEPT|nr:hypothetical protein [Leptospira koniambonensis]TGL36553.1 hypothetical protein EHQ52_01355 [Leptospira koniambonensis]